MPIVRAEDLTYTKLRALDPQIADAAARLLRLVASFRTTQIQTIAILPELQ